MQSRHWQPLQCSCIVGYSHEDEKPSPEDWVNHHYIRRCEHHQHLEGKELVDTLLAESRLVENCRKTIGLIEPSLIKLDNEGNELVDPEKVFLGLDADRKIVCAIEDKTALEKSVLENNLKGTFEGVKVI